MSKRIVKANGANGKVPVNWIAEGVKAGLVTLSADNKRITYRHHSPERIRLFQKVTIGSNVREAELMEAR